MNINVECKKISVVVPVYNVEQYISECIESIINQTFTNLEIILVDDGSTDNSGIICDKYSMIDSRIIVVHKENGGLVSARKAGVTISTGDYITFVDSDDWIDLNTYEYLLKKVGISDPDIIAYGNKKHYSNACIERYESLNEGFYTKNQIIDIIASRYQDENIAFDHIILVSVWNKLFKTELVKRNIEKISNSIIMCEDMALVIPCLFEMKTMYIVHYAPYNYRVRETSIMHTGKNNELYRTVLVIKRMYQSIFENNLIEIPSMKKLFVSYSYYALLLSDITKSIDDLSNLYSEINDISNILVYGNGVYGNNLKKLILKNEKYNFVGFIDKSSVGELEKYQDYDFIIIAITNSSVVETSVDLLLTHGVANDKIKYLKNEDLSFEKVCEYIK